MPSLFSKTMLAGILALSFSGCGAKSTDDGRVAVSGAVTQDGDPVPEGRIHFRPAPGSSGPTSGGEVRNGKFNISAERGPVLGEYVVTLNVGPIPEKMSMRSGNMKARRDAQGDVSTFEFTRRINEPGENLTLELSEATPASDEKETSEKQNKVGGKPGRK